MTRHVRLDAVDNFRDFGDYPTRHGRRIKRGVVYRSASHARATDADLAAIHALNIAVIVDLRRPDERKRDPSRRPPGFAGRVIDNGLNEGQDDDPWWTFIRGSDLSEASFRDYLITYYREAPFTARHVDLFARYFQALAAADGPVLIYCAAGKDRTGVLAALTHHVVGVSREQIFADYLLSNDPVRIAARAPMLAQMIEAETGRRGGDAAMRTAIGVKAEYLEAAFRAIEAEHGGLDAYLAAQLGVDAALRAALERRLLE